ncbi:MAG: glycosyltransferase family 9 protein [Elusimicrobia bacterium]|nr:glycosyltransferase family 9 protein [Elusimicrobiota bacterium]
MSKPTTINNILVIRFSSLGDVVLTTPVFTKLRHFLPETKISVLTKNQYQDVFLNNPHINEVLTLDQQENLTSLISRIRKNKYDLIIDLHSNLRSHLLGLTAGVKVIRYNKQSLNRYALLHLGTGNQKLNKSVVERYLETLNFLGPQQLHPETKIYLSEKEIRTARALLENNGLKPADIIIGLNPGAKWETKKWPLLNWVDFLTMCRNNKMKILLFGDDNDLAFISQIVKEMGNSRDFLVNLAGRTDLRQLMALIKQCRLLVTGDSGALHIAQALAVPVLILLGPTVPEFGFIRSNQDDAILYKDLPCRPCSLQGANYCKRSDRICLAGITAGEVFETMQEQMKVKFASEPVNELPVKGKING